MRCLTFFAPHALFDTDPAGERQFTPLGGLAQAGSLWIDAATFFFCGVALLGDIIGRRGVSIIACVLALFPLPIVFWHGAHDALDLWRGATWAAAGLAGVTIAHLARDGHLRIIIAATLLAVAAPMMIRGVGQITWEHADTIRTFEETKSEFLQQHGWSPESSAAKMYERRLRQPQPTGWFTTTNIFGSVMIYALIASLGLVMGALRAKLEGGWAAAMALFAIAATVMLSFTSSKGAVLAAFIGAALALGPLLIQGVGRLFAQRGGGVIMVALVIFTLVAVAARGLLLPESFAGEKSLLFRWHYTVASARMAVEHPWMGVGPDGFQDAYTLLRVPRNPEEVQSAHSMFWDWLTTLGIPAGAAWTVLIFTMLFRAVAPLRINPLVRGSVLAASNRFIVWSVLAIVAFGLMPAFFVEFSVLDARSVLLRVVGLGAFAAVAILTARLLMQADWRITGWCFAAGAVAIVVHGQIEMTFHQPGSVLWAMSGVGLAGALPARKGESRQPIVETLIMLCIAAATAWLIARGAVPATHASIALHNAAEEVLAHKNDPALLFNARRSAAKRLALAWQDTRPPDPFLLEAAAGQLELAANAVEEPASRSALLQQAIDLLQSPDLADRPSALGMLVSLQSRLAMMNPSESNWQPAINAARALTASDPHGLSTWRQLGDVLWAAGHHREAAEAYQRALECDANFSLDPLKQLEEKERAAIEERIAAANPKGSTR